MIEEKVSGTLTLSEAAGVLGVCSTTVNNWVKHEYISPVIISGTKHFRSHEIKKLKHSIDSGLIDRLARRANKKTAGKRFIPDEYIENMKEMETVRFIINSLEQLKIDTETALFLTALNILVNEDLADRKKIMKSAIIIKQAFKTPTLMEEMRNWQNSLKQFKFNCELNEILNFNIPGQQDMLGLIYQSLKSEGDKSFSGSYYTPRKIVDDIVSVHGSGDPRILDPCCGTGQFLLSFAHRVQNPSNLHGMDIDKTAVRIARLNLILKFKDREFTPNINHGNSLLPKINPGTETGRGDFDLVATNPPWGMHFSPTSLNSLQELHPEILSGESYSYFIKTGLDKLKDGGKLSFILPESILNVKVHRDIRSWILKNSSIERIFSLGRVFKNVFTPAIRLDIRKNSQRKSGKVILVNKNKKVEVDQEFFSMTPHYCFNINTSREDYSVIEKIYSTPHVTLKENAEWVLGIVTGNNKKYLSCSRKPGYEEIITGRGLESYRVKSAEKFINLRSGKFQQIAPMYKYRAGEKLVYKFISKRLVFAYDNRQRVTLNSANAVIPRLDNYPVKVILALFNSSVYQFLFQKKFSSIKVLRSHLEELPLPLWDRKIFNKITVLVDSILAGEDRIVELDRFITGCFSLTEDDIEV